MENLLYLLIFFFLVASPLESRPKKKKKTDVQQHHNTVPHTPAFLLEEIKNERTNNGGHDCPCIGSYYTALQLSSTGVDSQLAYICMLQAAEKYPTRPTAWLHLAVHKQDSALAPRFLEEATGSLSGNLVGKDNKATQRAPVEWYFVGPFPIGKTEHDADPVAALNNLMLGKDAPINRTQKYFSEYADNGMLSWSIIQPGMDGSITVAPNTVDWNRLVQVMGNMAIIEFQGWAIGYWHCLFEGAFLLHVQGVHTVWVGDVRISTDLYHRGHQAVLHLHRGVHRVAIRIRGKAQVNFRIKFERVAESSNKPKVQGVLYKPLFKPDVLVDSQDSNVGMLFGHWLALPFLNVAEIVLKQVHLFIVENDFVENVVVDNDEKNHVTTTRGVETAETIHSTWNGDGKDIEIMTLQRTWKPRAIDIPQGQLIPLIMKLRLRKVRSAQCPIIFQVGVKVDGEPLPGVSQRVELRCRGLRDSFVFTFIDHDGTVSEAAAVTPLFSDGAAPIGLLNQQPRRNGCTSSENTCVNDEFPVVLSQHGTGVSSTSQADAYKRKDRKDDVDYTFGISGAWLLAPSRHGAHNWEGVGRYTAVSALLHLHVVSTTFTQLPASRSRVLFTGHSMGGHGAWHLAVHESDRAIGIIPLASWIKKEYYGDSNLLWVFDVSASHMDGGLKGVLETSINENDNDLLLENVLGIPIVMRVGAADRTVHPWDSRKMVRLANELKHHAISLIELPNKEHWWWDTNKENDGGVVNDVQLRKHYTKILTQQSVTPVLPPHVLSSGTSTTFTFVTVNPAANSRRGGIVILQQIVPKHLSKVVVVHHSADGNSCGNAGTEKCVISECGGGWTMHISTFNVRRFQLYATSGVHLTPPSTVIIDNTTTLSCGELSNSQFANFYDNTLSFRIDSGNSPNPALGKRSRWIMESISGLSERLPHNSGPMRQVMTKPFIIVMPTASETVTRTILQEYQEAAVYLSNTHFMSYDTYVRIVPDTDAITGWVDGTFKSHNIIFLGGLKHNKFVAHLASSEEQIYSDWPVQFTEQQVPHIWEQFSIKLDKDERCGQSEKHSGIGVVSLVPVGVQNIGLVIAGTDKTGFQSAITLAEPTIPPMTRCPYGNMLPDCVVVDAMEYARKGVGGFLIAANWKAEDWSLHYGNSYFSMGACQ